MDPSDELLAEHHVLVPSDRRFQRKARLLQAMWRERHGLPIGQHRGRPLGSRLAMPFAKNTLANFMSDVVRQVVRAEVLDAVRSREKLYREPRIFEDLLSSQPLCFNAFGPLQRDLALASRVFSQVLRVPGIQVTAIEFEHSPGRGDARFTDDHSAFDVFVVYSAPALPRAFVAIEVKYVETLDAPPARHRARYEEVADAMGVFVSEKRDQLRRSPLEQLWRDHLLAGSLLLDQRSGFEGGAFAVVYPSENEIVGTAVASYRSCLQNEAGFSALTLEQLFDAIADAGGGVWSEPVRSRYLGTP